MRLRDIEFGQLFCAPGARGFYGEGYPFHQYWRFLGMSWHNTTFVAKTMTLEPRAGNMPLGKDGITPIEFLPKCIAVEPFSGHVVNAVGLSNPGAQALFASKRWEKLSQPFMLSFMSVAPSADERLKELNDYVDSALPYVDRLKTRVAHQLNFGCPNAGLHLQELNEEIGEALRIASRLNVPVVANFNPVTPLSILQMTAEHPDCDALWIANTVPWGHPGIDWKRIWGSTESPLTRRGLPSAGGLSGPACLPFTLDAVVGLRKAGVTKPIVAGNGIQSVRAAKQVMQAGASGIAIGAIAIVRPWRMPGIIRYFTDNSGHWV